MILAIETSCDDTCAAVLDGDGRLRSNVISSQVVHELFGGVVPEIASRHHLDVVEAIVARALSTAGASLEQVDIVAATQGPGLVGALLVGLSTAKALAASRELPLAPVDHLQGHIAANFLAPDASAPRNGTGPAEDDLGEPLEPPFVCLIASGGHTLLARVEKHDGYEVLGRTLDDAAGEAFDKGARLLGLGYPGGAALERLAADGDPHAFAFPGSQGDRAAGGRGAAREAFAKGLDFSFAGVKTALLYKLRELSPQEVDAHAADLAASYQAAIVESLAVRCELALERSGLERLALGGGVAANGVLRGRVRELGIEVRVPPRELCTDNAGMIASAARYGAQLAYPEYLGLDAYATGERVA